MMDNIYNTQIMLSDALYELSMAKEVPDAELLDDFVRRYPGYAADLTEFAIELAVDALQPKIEDPEIFDASRVSPAVSRAMSKFQNALRSPKKREETSASPRTAHATQAENPFAGYDRKGFHQLTEDLHSSLLFTCKLRDRGIDASTMTYGFMRFVADRLHVPVEVIAAHFAGQATMPRAQFHRADQKPEAGRQQTFEEAIRSSGLTEEQEKFLLSL